MIDQKIIDKIQKLLNLAEGAEAVGSMAEAENAASKVQALLMQYNLDIETVKASKIQARAEFFDGYVNLSDKQDKRESFWVPKLFNAIARHNFCKCFPRQQGVYIVGEKSQVELVLYIAEQMVAKVRIAEKYAWKIYDAKPEGRWDIKEKRGTYRRGFFEGACHGIDQRLARDKRAMEHTFNPFAIMIVKKEKEVQDYWNEHYLKPAEEKLKQMEAQEEQDRINGVKPKKEKAIKPRKGPRGLGSNAGWREGYDAGLVMDINKGIEGQSSKGNLN